jgi:hypothetical protein
MKMDEEELKRVRRSNGGGGQEEARHSLSPGVMRESSGTLVEMVDVGSGKCKGGPFPGKF